MTATVRTRGRKWVAIRRAVLLRDGYRCQQCGRITGAHGLEVDHIVPLAKGGTDADDNLRALCIPCHAGAKGEQFGTRRAVGVDGWPV